MPNIVELSLDNFETEVLASSRPVLVDFYAPWCGPCKMIAPLLEQLAVHYDDQIKFAKANVDELIELATEFRIAGVPTLMLFHRGKVVNQLVGFPGPQVLVQLLESSQTKDVAATEL